MPTNIPNKDIRQRPFSDDTQRSALCRALRGARIAAGLTQTDLAGRLGLPQSFVSKYETGQRRLDLIDLLAVCRAIEIDLRELLARFEGEILTGDGVEAG